MYVYRGFFLTSRCVDNAVCVVVCVCLSFAWELGVRLIQHIHVTRMRMRACVYACVYE